MLCESWKKLCEMLKLIPFCISAFFIFIALCIAAFFILITLCMASFFISAYEVIGVCVWAWNELCLCIALRMAVLFIAAYEVIGVCVWALTQVIWVCFWALEQLMRVCFWAWNKLCLWIALCIAYLLIAACLLVIESVRMGRHFFNFLARFKNTSDDDVSLQPHTPAPGDYTMFERKDTTSEPLDKGSDDEYEDANSEIDDDECDDEHEDDISKGEQDCICGRRVWRPNPEIEDEKCGDDELTSEKHLRKTVEKHLFHTWQVLNWSEEKLKRRNDTIHKLEVKLQSLKTLEVKLLSLKTCDF